MTPAEKKAHWRSTHPEGLRKEREANNLRRRLQRFNARQERAQSDPSYAARLMARAIKNIPGAYRDEATYQREYYRIFRAKSKIKSGSAPVNRPSRPEDHDGFKFRQRDGIWMAVEGCPESYKNKISLTTAECKKIDACYKRRGLTMSERRPKRLPLMWA